MSHSTTVASIYLRKRSGVTVLVADGDEWTRQTVALSLGRLGVRVCEADTGMATIAEAQGQPIDLLLLDLHLPDISALQLVATLKEKGIYIPWILYGTRMMLHLAVEAIKSGATNAVELPFDIPAIVLPALDEALKRRAMHWPPLPLTPYLRPPKSAAERWAWLVLRGCDSDHDLRTLREWARFVAMSCSGLAETCRMTGVKGHQARDLMRVLRILLHTRGRVDNVEGQLDISDERTLRRILDRAGFLRLQERVLQLSFSQFLSYQRFVEPNGGAARTIAEMFEGVSTILPRADHRDLLG